MIILRIFKSYSDVSTNDNLYEGAIDSLLPVGTNVKTGDIDATVKGYEYLCLSRTTVVNALVDWEKVEEVDVVD